MIYRTLAERMKVFREEADLYPVISSEFCAGRDPLAVIRAVLNGLLNGLFKGVDLDVERRDAPLRGGLFALELGKLALGSALLAVQFLNLEQILLLRGGYRIRHRVQNRLEDRDTTLSDALPRVLVLVLDFGDEFVEVGHRAGRNRQRLSAKERSNCRSLLGRGVRLRRQRRCLRRDP